MGVGGSVVRAKLRLKAYSAPLKLKLGVSLAINFESIAFTTEVYLIAKLSPNINLKTIRVSFGASFNSSSTQPLSLPQKYNSAKSHNHC